MPDKDVGRKQVELALELLGVSLELQDPPSVPDAELTDGLLSAQLHGKDKVGRGDRAMAVHQR
jgi:hypothetical protein